MPPPRNPASPFRYVHSSAEVIGLVVTIHARFPPSLRDLEDLLFERGIDLCPQTVRRWWNPSGPVFAADIRRERVSRMRGFRQWRWHGDEMSIKVTGGLCSDRAAMREPAKIERREVGGRTIG